MQFASLELLPFFTVSKVLFDFLEPGGFYRWFSDARSLGPLDDSQRQKIS